MAEDAEINSTITLLGSDTGSAANLSVTVASDLHVFGQWGKNEKQGISQLSGPVLTHYLKNTTSQTTVKNKTWNKFTLVS